MRPRWLDGVAVALLVAALAVRLVRLDAFIAADELRWVCRSLSFGQALASGDFKNTFQTGHPGVVTMWLGTLAVPPSSAPAAVLDTCRLTENAQSPSAANAGQLAGLADTLWQMRVAAGVFNSLLLMVIYGLTRRLVGPWLALGGLTLLAFDPFLLAHSRVLHLDAGLSALMVISVLLLISAWYTGKQVDRETGRQGANPLSPAFPVSLSTYLPVSLSGLIAGIALTQKVAAVFLWPCAGLMLIALAGRVSGVTWRRSLTPSAVGILPDSPAKASTPAALTHPASTYPLSSILYPLLRLSLAWGLALVLGVVLVWPAMWVNPVGTIQGVIAKAEVEGGNPHQAGQVIGEEIVDDPGPLMYLLALAFRASPWMLIGLLVGGWWLIRRRKSDPLPLPMGEGWGEGLRSVVVTLFAFALLFGLLIALSPKKFDRYLLPAFPPLDLVAGISLAALAERLHITHYALRFRRPIAFALLLVVQLAIVLPHAPYYLTYYNPALGGGPVAARWLLIGWGEGYDQAAAYLNSLPNSRDTQAAVRGVSQFAPVFVGETRSAPGYRSYQTDYVVLYSNEVQRRRNEGMIQRFYENPNEKPVHVVRLHGLDYAWIYANTTATQALTDLTARSQPGDVVMVNGASLASKGLPVGLNQAKVYGHFGPTETAEALAPVPPGARLWYVRYTEADPGVILDALREHAILEGEPRRYPELEVWTGRVGPQAKTPLQVQVEGLRLVGWGTSQYFPPPVRPKV